MGNELDGSLKCFTHTAQEALHTWDYIADDRKFLACLLTSEWSLGPGENPRVEYDESSFAKNPLGGGIGIISIYDLGFPEGEMTGINYDGTKRSHNLSIVVANKDKARHYNWINEVESILDYYRRAGRARLNGWDYLKVGMRTPAKNYVAYWETNIEVRLINQVFARKTNGRALVPRLQYLADCERKEGTC